MIIDGCGEPLREDSTCDFPEVLKILDKKGKEAETEKEICNAFRAFDVKGKGVISSKKMKEVMTSMGEKLSDEEFDLMIREAECYNGDGKIKYETLPPIIIKINFTRE